MYTSQKATKPSISFRSPHIPHIPGKLGFSVLKWWVITDLTAGRAFFPYMYVWAERIQINQCWGELQNDARSKSVMWVMQSVEKWWIYCIMMKQQKKKYNIEKVLLSRRRKKITSPKFNLVCCTWCLVFLRYLQFGYKDKYCLGTKIKLKVVRRNITKSNDGVKNR